MKHLKKFSTNTERATYEGSDDYIEPYVSLVEQDDSVHYNLPHDYSKDYFTTVALEDGTISFNIWESMGTDMITSISYSTDNGETWTTTPNQNNKTVHLSIDVNVNDGDKVMWKGSARKFGYFDEDEYGDYVGSFFSSDCEFDAQGNIMSLLYGDDFYDEIEIYQEYEFCYLFHDYNNNKSCGIVNAKNLSLCAPSLNKGSYYGMFLGCTSLTLAPELSATTLANYCYSEMFRGCTSLTTAPELPATALANDCYSNMFADCTSLTTAPQLPATTLAEACYWGMFQGCTSLTTGPVLPATQLADSCYKYMFNGCINLTTAPELPATTLAEHCYSYMFYGCTSLTTAPELPATILTQHCYSNMFNGCTNLNHIKAMFTTPPSTAYTQNWLYGVASSGTFVKNSAATWTTTGKNGIPNGWTVQTASE